MVEGASQADSLRICVPRLVSLALIGWMCPSESLSLGLRNLIWILLCEDMAQGVSNTSLEEHWRSG